MGVLQNVKTFIRGRSYDLFCADNEFLLRNSVF